MYKFERYRQLGLPGFQNEPPYVPSLLVEFRKRLNDGIMTEINKMIIAFNPPDDPGSGNGAGAVTRTGHYPERALADKIYRNRENLAFCRLHGIRLFGSSLGRPKKNALIDKKSEYVDNADRIEVERSFQ